MMLEFEVTIDGWTHITRMDLTEFDNHGDYRLQIMNQMYNEAIIEIVQADLDSACSLDLQLKPIYRIRLSRNSTRTSRLTYDD